MKLSTVSEIVEQWLMVQNMWMYMEAVFSGGDIVKQLPLEAKRFQNIDKNYMKIVTSAIENPNVVSTCAGSELMKNMLPHLLEQLELCQKSLSAYLETKRAEFPRFYFVSDPTLLEILSLGSDPPSVVPHFQSGLFDSLSNVSFDKADKTRMLEMFSQQSEKVGGIPNPAVGPQQCGWDRVRSTCGCFLLVDCPAFFAAVWQPSPCICAWDLYARHAALLTYVGGV
eukprot:GHRQ01023059.1.p1 GENE.GHRQ01023059.1~~GHRQ01023059.1.p1  ORF type:complete len:226 (+),score=83.51 GHRQ01023059.1:1687-2364(+)